MRQKKKNFFTVKEVKERMEMPDGKEDNYSNAISEIKQMSEENVIRKSVLAENVDRRNIFIQERFGLQRLPYFVYI
jgi:hypothetical protein